MRIIRTSGTAAILAVAGLVGAGHAAPIGVCATTPTLGALVREIGGSDVTLTVFARPTEDPHAVEVRPAFAKILGNAELLVVDGLGLEAAWLPALQQSAHNPRVAPGGTGYLDASVAIRPLDVPSGLATPTDGGRPGDPHYLLDPVNGVAVAGEIRDALGRLRPGEAEAFRSRWEALRDRVAAALVGRTLAGKHDGLALAKLAAEGGLDRFLADHGEAGALGGWLAALAPYRGAKIVADHAGWGYFARRFGLEVVAAIEPAAGRPPTARRLAETADTMRRDHVVVLLASADVDPRPGSGLARETGARMLAMATEVGARPGASDYVSTIGFDVRQVAAGLEHGLR